MITTLSRIAGILLLAGVAAAAAAPQIPSSDIRFIGTHSQYDEIDAQTI